MDNRITPPQPSALVIFGASGDLTHRKLVPALANLAQDAYLPENFVVVGASRTKMTDEEFRTGLKSSVEKYSRRKIRPEVWEAFSKNIYYQPTDGTNPKDFISLRERLTSLEKEKNTRFNFLYYLSVAPQNFASIAMNLKAAGLVENPRDENVRQTRIVVEKPFGHDLLSAQKLNKELTQFFDEEQIFRIDHYLGKETVQNILVFRFGNGIFEPLWNSKYIEQIQISVSEDIGVGSRAAYFDETGILRDFVQNHVLQVVSLLCIEPPISLTDANSIRDEKVKVLRSMQRLLPDEVPLKTLRAQYTKGKVGGQEVSGYLEEKGVLPNSTTETFVALQLEIDNWRWAGVPIYIKVGKRLSKRETEVSVFFKRPPLSPFHGRDVGEVAHNILTIQVQPREAITLNINSKPPGPRLKMRSVEMDFNYHGSFEEDSPEAYERLLLDAMKGNATLFIRNDEIEEAWSLLSPILESWNGDSPPMLYHYSSGTEGPESMHEIVRRNGHKWREHTNES